MNEGKPTKAKWWSRPRLQGPSGRTDGTAEPSPGPAPVPNADGDFELERPIADTSAEGDYELSGPAVETVPSTRSGTAASAESSAASAEATPLATAALPEEAAPLTESAPLAESAVPPADERPRPLHDPDPYSTPPYGEPGPWAPAPPVQHPATTPAHGTAVPATAPAHGAAIPTPSHGTSVPASAPAPSPMPIPPPGQGHGTPLPPPSSLQGAAPAPWQNYDPWAPAPLTGPLQQNGAAVRSEGQKRRRAKRVLLIGALLVALVSGGIGGAVGTYLERNGGVGDVELPQVGAEPTGRAADSVAGIAARALPSVVTLHVSGAEEAGTGTGFVLDDRGHILTNNHVVQPAGSDGEITVTFHSGDTAKATVVGRDSGYDLAVVKVTGVSGLSPMTLGNSDNVQVGDPVVAIGAPFDLAGTVTSGIISAKERPITAGGESGDASDVSYVDALQTDAPINPGNSGGPLLDAKARVIGINSAIRSADSGSEPDGGQAGSIGLGFAIPINQGKRVAEELINTGRATHPVIGVTLDMDYSGDGARVGTKASDGGPPVTTGGPGDRAGIEPGDVITEVDGQRVHSGEELIVKTRSHRPGDRLELTLERDGKEITLALTLGSSDGD
ncbi:trypsin-like peptidase domain-containing protein [Streptomyces cinnabarinus]|uniref:Trypsin-like peptidase domain-containing protein n=1 Tax=Streptomyces cinnabarinus TaxID=67287 RepID=A0ABY7KJT7_9ACTN|nr:trypsin-like peptidase domain-containing protein [Streptomyces cinnabarinus]WAZ23950.1 trypsin-like peptidase domain-containing protein [Streptomyces cinnabarinus]